ncbi:ATP-dependent DNA helicase RecG [Candidatus Gracilibacteria bacterium]|nr:ATP-dependent DNA helicase RecG [Candidatus Gracilibacteria bacterium]MCF7856262.1 ATP-dependent DNA helicase RecG [Candidatus Gracilibacteria bacterium]MCF7896259.1 ATP-dependent DNA helicase RecG [Candidatus Gracilibacteria bacterium]
MDIRAPLSETLATTSRHLKALAEIGVTRVEDFLNYFPRTYADFSAPKKFSELIPGETATVVGKVQNLKTFRTPRGRTIISAKLISEDGSLNLTWFNQTFIARILRNGDEIAISGRIQIGPRGAIALIGGSFEKISDEMIHAGRIVPIYRSHGKLISSKWLREKLYPLLDYTSKLPPLLPVALSAKENLLSRGEAIRQIHFPDSFEKLERARESLAFEELFFLQLGGLRRKLDWQIGAAGSGKIISHSKALLFEFAAALPFKFTAAQKISSAEILRDLQKDLPMNRLLEGDVGSGKTVVAALAIFLAAKNGFQAALLAPTEILASQHFRNFLWLLHPLGIRGELLTGSTPAKKKKEIASKLKSGELDLVVGTHALLEAKIDFQNLGLAVIDEQHRFGVEQRTLIRKNGTPHVLSLTATPIPRTLALTIFGDQDVSIIDEMPPGRIPPITRIIPPQKRIESERWIESEVEKGRQVFIVCPLVEESETLEVKSAKKEFARLSEKVFPQFKLGLLHGKLRPKEKDATMAAFAAGEIQILVATTVIEVGIDIPNATIMLIEAAERFGLAQLHQLRGRVGRGSDQSYCFLFSESDSEEAKTRLHALENISSGFELAKMDLKLRGPGEVFGMRQSGIPDLKVAKLTDHEIIKRSRDAAESLLEKDPTLKNYPEILFRLKEVEERRDGN